MVINFLKKAKVLIVSYLFKKILNSILKTFGFTLLDQDQTVAFLEKDKVAEHAINFVMMPQVKLFQKDTIVFEAGVAESKVSFVWSLATSGTSVQQLKNGAIKVYKHVLCTDFDHSGFYKTITNTKKRLPRITAVLIAPWTQFTDGVFYGGYYDFIFLVFAKLCRIKEAIPDAEFANALISYPLFETPYEVELLKLLGIAPENVVDSREHDIEFNKVIIGNSGHWFYPNIADVYYLKKLINSSLQITKTKNSRIYISRLGRRKIINEAELIVLLQKFDFEIIEDEFYTIPQQAEIYKNASFIIGPHGASFSNIIWCEPGTHLLELFSPNYMPNHYRYLANLMGLSYSAYYHGTPGKGLSSTNTLLEDVYVSIKDMEGYLSVLLNEVPATERNLRVVKH